MTNDWVKISKNKYCKNVDSKIFTLTLQNIGIYASGLSWVLRGSLLTEDEILTSYWIKDDGYKNYLTRSEENCLWSESEISFNANQIIEKLIKVLK